MRARILGILLLLCAAPALAPTVLIEGNLEMVVALFRHGVRAPLHNIDDQGRGRKWPPMGDWRVNDWGELTPQGFTAATQLGKWYAARYKNQLPAPVKAYLWADVDGRTKRTAEALANGLSADNMIPAKWDKSSSAYDPLFHAFRAICTKPSAQLLNAIAANITNNSSQFKKQYSTQLNSLYKVLNCANCGRGDSASDCARAETCCKAPITWTGEFPFANTASETFLLEYENNMQVGWPDTSVPEEQIRDLMQLHEFFFDRTQRDQYLAEIDASNLIREIMWRLDRTQGVCRRLPDDAPFCALVGHDTNIASVARLLGLHWSFRNAPEGTRGLPDNDPLPAGAIVFERWQPKKGDPLVRILYMAQGIRQVRTCTDKGPCPAFPLVLRTMTLNDFRDLANKVAKPDFQCCTGQDLCPK